MIHIISGKDSYSKKAGWLQSRHLFSFAEYYDESNTQWGNLCVFNDDKIAAGKGFGMHPHDEMEIITIVLSGKLKHKDSMGNEEEIQAGEVQVMSAGTGIVHSEYNSGEEELSLYQIWIYPNKAALKPSYRQKKFAKTGWKNKLCLIASSKKAEGALAMNANATIYRAELEALENLELDAKKEDKLFAYLTHGEIEINGSRLGANFQARISGEKKLGIKALKDSEFILINCSE